MSSGEESISRELPARFVTLQICYLLSSIVRRSNLRSAFELSVPKNLLCECGVDVFVNFVLATFGKPKLGEPMVGEFCPQDATEMSR